MRQLCATLLCGDSLCTADLTSVLEAQRQHEPAGLPTYDASAIARRAILRHMLTREAPPEPVLAIDVRQFRLEGPQSERGSVTSSWHVAHETMAAAQTSATQRGVTLNSFLLGTLAWVLHDVSEQRCFAISQTYLGRTMDELRAQAEAGGAHLEEIFLKVTGGEAMSDIIDSLREAIEK